MSKICNSCHMENEDNAKFCRSCGKSFDVIDDDKNKINNNAKSEVFQKEQIDKIIESEHNSDNVFFDWLVVALTVVSIIVVVLFWKSLGLLTLLFPIIMGVGLLKFKVADSIIYHLYRSTSSLPNASESGDIDNKKENISLKCNTWSYFFLFLAGVLFYLFIYTRSTQPLYVAIVSYIIGLVLMIISVVYAQKNKLHRGLTIVYIVFTTIIIIFIGVFSSCISDCSGFPA